MSNAAVAGPARISSANSFFERLAAAVAEYFAARKTIRALSDLSDRELDDIGLCRGDIAEVAYGRR